MYWFSPQQLTNHAVCGCSEGFGYLMGTGTISDPSIDSYGSLLELTWNGKNLITLYRGENRTFIEDEETLIMTKWCQGENYRVGFVEVSGIIKLVIEYSFSKE